MDYETFIDAKRHVGIDHGFDPVWMPDILFPFQRSITEWACRKGRAAIFADCGLGKTFNATRMGRKRGTKDGRAGADIDSACRGISDGS